MKTSQLSCLYKVIIASYYNVTNYCHGRYCSQSLCTVSGFKGLPPSSAGSFRKHLIKPRIYTEMTIHKLAREIILKFACIHKHVLDLVSVECRFPDSGWDDSFCVISGHGLVVCHYGNNIYDPNLYFIILWRVSR